MPSWERRLKSCNASAAEAGSRLARGSSRRRTLGFMARTPARATFCFSPPEREKVSLSLKCKILR